VSAAYKDGVLEIRMPKPTPQQYPVASRFNA
jgi:HSP20 family molecular chaperone IbpA